MGPRDTDGATDGARATVTDARELPTQRPARDVPPPTLPTQRPARTSAPAPRPAGTAPAQRPTSAAAGRAAGAAPALPVEPSRRAPGVRGLVPTQRPHGAPAPSRTAGSLASGLAVPQQRGPLADPAAPVEVRTTPRRRRALRAVAVAGLVALTATGGWVAQDRAHRHDVARAEARARVDVAAAGAAEQPAPGARVEAATWTGARSSEVAALTTAVETATATLAATTHAGDEARTALQRAIDTARTAAADDSASLHALRTARAGLVAPQKAAQDAEAAWQKAEEARKAAEAAAAAERARQRAQAPAAPRTGTRPAPPRSGSEPSRPPAQRGIPSGGLRCQGTGGSGAREASASSLGSAINAYRASLGLKKLTIARSGSLTAHALDMGTRGGIWHSGGDNIVGCVGTSTPSYLVQAWSHSASHDRQMRRTDVSTMYVGAATQSGWLFGAVLFR